ncbi:MAG TPA: hypothetical protein VFS05_00270 [Gemmatimonadaceae bacterium]|nr:hypothetical protein [Gemmatimonadaceae bacterium]
MSPFFPRETIEWHVEEPAALRRLSLSLPAMAVLSGVLIRLYRLAVLTWLPTSNPWGFIAAYAGGLLIVLGLATLHLGNYPVRHWIWRAPLFGAIEAAAALLTSALLVSAGVERMGTSPMTWSALRADIVPALVRHVATIGIFALILAIVVQTVRVALLRHEHREHTLEAVHDSNE